MGIQFKSIQISILIHGLILALIIGGNAWMPQLRRPIPIDFEIERLKEEPSPPPAPVKRRPESKQSEKPFMRPVPEKKIKKQPEKPVEKPIEEIWRIEPLPAEKTISAAAGRPEAQHEIPNNASGAAGSGTGSGAGTAAGSGRGTAPSAETAKTIYIKDHFAYIRDKILRNVSYPPVAVRMGWQGRVSVTFIIRPNGTVKNIVVSRSSTIKALDDNAVETVQNSAPFPKPPVEAQITIPITYRIN